MGLFLDAIQEGNKSNSRRQRGEYIYHFNASHIILGPLHRRACATSAYLLFGAAELEYNILGPIVAALDPILNIVTSMSSLCFEMGILLKQEQWDSKRELTGGYFVPK